jgi:hypothetical protein
LHHGEAWLEKSVQPFRHAFFVREIFDFVQEIAHGFLLATMSLAGRIRKGRNTRPTHCEIELHSHETGL